jgi:hypothetical protein
MEQPLRQPRLTGRGARGVEQLKEGSFAEDIQIFGVNVMGIAKTISRVAGPGPGTVEPGKAARVERQGAFGQCAIAAQTVQANREKRKDGGWREEPKRVDRLARINKPREHESNDGGCQPGVPGGDELALCGLEARFPEVVARGVLGARGERAHAFLKRLGEPGEQA